VFRGPRVPSTSVAELPDDVFLLDVREDDEWTAGHAPGAVHVPMMEIPIRTDEVPDDRDVVVVCRMGQRSAQVVAWLMQNGYDRVINLDGGMAGWEAAGRPLVSEDGGVGTVI
jgi:rhodanese-related sulfurtransferase